MGKPVPPFCNRRGKWIVKDALPADHGRPAVPYVKCGSAGLIEVAHDPTDIERLRERFYKPFEEPATYQE